MMIIKKYWYFFLLALFLFLMIFMNTSSNKTKLRKYLVNNGFNLAYKNEVKKTSMNEDKYDKQTNGTIRIESFDYKDESFSQIVKSKTNNDEDVMTMIFYLDNGTYTSSYNVVYEYGEWFIEGQYNVNNDIFTCNTRGYKGLGEYCDKLKKEMKDYKNIVESYLYFSKTDKHYLNKIYKK